MDIQHLLDRLEDLIDEGRHVPFGKYTMIDEERALELIDQMRISIPDEIEKSSRILAQRDRVLAQANEEAARIVQSARETGTQLIDREATVQAAQSRAANVIEQARQEALELSGETDRYVMEKLADLERRLDRMMREVRAGIEHINSAPNPHVYAPPPSLPQPQANYASSTFAPPRETLDVNNKPAKSDAVAG